jgi:hypothetical protein
MRARGHGGVPAGAVGIAGNATVRDDSYAWAIYLEPSSSTAPGTSTINFNTGDVKSNGVVTALPSGGCPDATYLTDAAARTTKVILDFTGYSVK